MTTKIVIIVGVSVAMVVGMFLMGWLLNRGSADDNRSEGTAQER